MSSPRTVAADSNVETGGRNSIENNGNERHEPHAQEQATKLGSQIEESTKNPATQLANMNSAIAPRGDKKDSPIDESTIIEPPATRTPRKRKTRVDALSEGTPTKKRKAAFSGVKGASDLDPDSTDTSKPAAAKKLNKRKAAGDAATNNTPAKRPRRQTAKAADAAASTPKPRRAPNTHNQDDRTAVPPPPTPPVRVSAAVATKIQQVHNFMQTYPPKKFERIALFPRTVRLSERDLSGIVSRMYWQWEISLPQDSVMSEIQDVVDCRFQQELGTNRVPTTMVSVDINSMSRLEERVQEKVLRHGLEGKSLLYVEMKMFDAYREARSGSFMPDVERLLEAVADDTGECKVEDEQVDSAQETSSPLSSPLTMESDEKVFGVCPAPMQEV